MIRHENRHISADRNNIDGFWNFDSSESIFGYLCKFRSGYLHYFTLRPFAALARPLPRVPRSPPRAAPPLPEGAAPPRLPPILDAGAGVENFEVALEDVGGFSTNEVSVVLQGMS